MKAMFKEGELNKKLAEWAGFKDSGHHWYNPEGNKCMEPNFTQSLDACFKWLVPKLDYWSIGTSGTQFVGWARGKGKEGKFCQMVIYNTPALALCLAIDRLIDSVK